MQEEFEVLNKEEIEQYEAIRLKYYNREEVTRKEKKLFNEFNTRELKHTIHKLRLEMETAKKNSDKKIVKKIKKEIKETKKYFFEEAHPTLAFIGECICSLGELFESVSEVRVEVSDEEKTLLLLGDDD